MDNRLFRQQSTTNETRGMQKADYQGNPIGLTLPSIGNPSDTNADLPRKSPMSQ